MKTEIKKLMTQKQWKKYHQDCKRTGEILRIVPDPDSKAINFIRRDGTIAGIV